MSENVLIPIHEIPPSLFYNHVSDCDQGLANVFEFSFVFRLQKYSKSFPVLTVWDFEHFC